MFFALFSHGSKHTQKGIIYWINKLTKDLLPPSTSSTSQPDPVEVENNINILQINNETKELSVISLTSEQEFPDNNNHKMFIVHLMQFFCKVLRVKHRKKLICKETGDFGEKLLLGLFQHFWKTWAHSVNALGHRCCECAVIS